MLKIDFSLVIACYNEGPSFPQSLNKIWEILKDTRLSYEIICIDDCSRDETLKNLKFFSRNKKNVLVLSHKVNVGRGGTVKEGFFLAKGKTVGFIDVDLEVSPVYIPEFIRVINKGFDVAIATRIYPDKFTSISRWLASKLYVKLVNKLLNLNYKDTEAGYKFFNRIKLLPILKKSRDNGWFFDTEIVTLSHRNKLKIAEIPVLFLRRLDKQSTVRLIPDTIDYLKAIYRFKSKR